MLPLRLGLVFCAFAVGTPAMAAPPPAPRAITFEALRGLVRVRAPQISPDGRRVVYVRSTVDEKADRFASELVLVDVATGAARVLTHDRVAVDEPRWTPDGAAISFLAPPEKAKPAQLYRMPMDGGDAQRLTNAGNGVLQYAWRPDGRVAAFVTPDDLPNKAAIARHDDAFRVTDEHYLTRQTAAPHHLWLVDADGAHAHRLTSGSWSVATFGGNRLSWTADGTKLLYQHAPDAIDAHWVHDVTMVRDVAGGAEHPLVAAGMDDDALLSPDGKTVALLVPRHGTPYLTQDVALETFPAGRAIGSTLALDRNVHWSDFAPDGSLLVGTTDGVRQVLWTLPPGGSAHRVDLGDVDFAADGTVARTGALAFVGHLRTRAPEIYVYANGAVKALTTDNAAIDALPVGDSRAIDFTTDDGMHADGVLTYPPGYAAGSRLPLVMVIHGGPVSSTNWNFDAFAQVLAGRGYLVFQPNYRGSDNLGDAYLQAIVGDVTSGPGRDNLAGLAAVEKLGIVDPARVFVSGWSGGGLQTSWLVGHTTMFRAAVSGAAVNDWYEQAVLADIGEDFAQAFIPGVSPFTRAGRAAYEAESPITFARNIRTPLLILSDTGDQRVPITQSYALYHALADRHAVVKFVAFPRAGHFPADPVGAETAYRTWADWFDRWRG